MTCKNCGNELADNAKFCPECGASINGAIANTNTSGIGPDKKLPITNRNLISVRRTAEEAERALTKVEPNTKGILDEKEIDSDIVKLLKGTDEIEKIQSKAKCAFGKYETLVESYNKGKEITAKLITDFVAVRNDIDQMYHKYLMALTDIFGDGIRSVSPDMFEFESVQYLDVMAMFDNFKSQYEEIKAQCNNNIVELESNFSIRANNVLDAALAGGVASESLSGGLVTGLFSLAGNAVAHYLESSEKTNQMKEEYESLKNTIRHDVDNIEADSYRCLQ